MKSLPFGRSRIRPAGRGRVSFSPVKEFALSHGLKSFNLRESRTTKRIDLFASHDADVAVVVAYGTDFAG